MDEDKERSGETMKTTMMDNIYDQPRALQHTFESSDAFCKPWCSFLKTHESKKIYILGSGTSYHAALGICTYIQTFMKMECDVCIPTVFARYECIDSCHQYKSKEIVVIGISQSGTSLSTIAAMQHAQRQGYHTICLTENMNSLITQYCEVVLPLLCGQEGIPIETRGYSVTILTGLLMALYGAYTMHKMDKEMHAQLCKEINTSLPFLSIIIHESDQWQKRNRESLLRMSKGSICGYGTNYYSAMEAALKLYETFHQPVFGYEMTEMMHGYEMAFDQNQYVYMIAGAGDEVLFLDTYRSFLDELCVQQFVITCENTTVRKQDLKFSVCPSSLLDMITYVIPFQVLAARNCEMIGYDTSIYPHQRKSFSHQRDGGGRICISQKSYNI